ncbi:MAG: hypothetical protein AB7G93_14485 [Bdellovibrionales bacterium]
MHKWIATVLIISANLAGQSSLGEKAYADANTDRISRAQGRLGADLIYEQTWILNGRTANEEQLVKAIMDFWGGDPGTLCFVLPEMAIGFVQQAFSRSHIFQDSLVSVQMGGSDGRGIVVTTRSPFGDSDIAPMEFRHCIGDELLISKSESDAQAPI